MKKWIATVLTVTCALTLFSCRDNKKGNDQPMGEISELPAENSVQWAYAEDATLQALNEAFDVKKAAADAFYTIPQVTGTTYYISSNNGSDSNSGKSPEQAWENFYMLNSAGLKEGDAVLFECGSIFRVQRSQELKLVSGVTYASYGTGEKPEFYGTIEASNAAQWRAVSGVSNLYQYQGTLSSSNDIGTIIFGDGEAWGIKIQEIYKWEDFDANIKTWLGKSLALTNVSNGLQTFDKISSFELDNGKGLGKYGKYDLTYYQDGTKLYLYCEGGNPAERFGTVELSQHVKSFTGSNIKDVTIANINFFGGTFAIRTTVCDNLVIKNCGFEFIGGQIQADYENSARNYKTRLGNAIENWNECKGMTVENCYFNQIYDTAMTTQSNTDGTDMVNIIYRNNVMENLVYAIELWSSGAEDKHCDFKDISINGNVCRNLGIGLTSQRPDKLSGFLSAKGSYYDYSNASITDNIIMDSTHWIYRTNYIQTESNTNGYLLDGNTYVHELGKDIGLLSASFPKASTSIKEASYSYETAKSFYDAGAEKNGKFYYTSSSGDDSDRKVEMLNSYILDAVSYTYTLKDGESLAFRLILPAGYDASKSYKLLTYFNYEYASGKDNFKNVQMANELLAELYADGSYILLVPQCPEGTWTGVDVENGNYSTESVAQSAVMKAAYGLIHDIALKYNTVGNYAVGVSAGGYAVADLCARYENLVKAGVIIAGAGDPNASIGNTQLLIIHGEGDEKIAVSNAQTLASAWGAEYKEMTRELHDCWNTAFKREDICGWLNSK